MVKLQFILLIIYVVFAEDQINESVLERMLESVPMEERPDFVKYHLQLGYQYTQMPNPSFEGYSQEFSIKVYQYFKEMHPVTDGPIVNIKDTICFPNGECVDDDDPAVYPP